MEGVQQNLGGQKTSKIRRDFWQLSTLSANTCGTDRRIENLKSTLSTTTPPLLYEQNWWTLVHQQKVIGVNVSQPKWTFQETTFRPLGGAARQIFTHPTATKIVFPVGLAMTGSLKLGFAPYFWLIFNSTLTFYPFASPATRGRYLPFLACGVISPPHHHWQILRRLVKGYVRDLQLNKIGVSQWLWLSLLRTNLPHCDEEYERPTSMAAPRSDVGLCPGRQSVVISFICSSSFSRLIHHNSTTDY